MPQQYVFRILVEGQELPIFEQTDEAGETMISLVRRYGKRIRRIESVPRDRSVLELGYDPSTGSEIIPRNRVHQCH